MFLKKVIFLFTCCRQLWSKDKEMPEINFGEMRKKRKLSSWLKDAFFVILALVFIALYAAAFAGKLDPLKDNTMLIRIEPVIFILIGYYFGRHPSHQCEAILQEEILRQSYIAQAAQAAKENLLKSFARLEEKISYVRMEIENFGNSDQEPNENALKRVSAILDS